jgi:formylmethanofuran dehydrogenase subunit E
MPSEERFNIMPVELDMPVSAIISRPRVHVPCAACGGQIMNGRTVPIDGARICKACAHEGYFRFLAPEAGLTRWTSPTWR